MSKRQNAKAEMATARPHRAFSRASSKSSLYKSPRRIFTRKLKPHRAFSRASTTEEVTVQAVSLTQQLQDFSKASPAEIGRISAANDQYPNGLQSYLGTRSICMGDLRYDVKGGFVQLEDETNKTCNNQPSIHSLMTVLQHWNIQPIANWHFGIPDAWKRWLQH